MARPSKYPQQLRERAVSMVLESRGDYESEYAAIKSIAAKLGSRRLSRCASGSAGRRSMGVFGRARPLKTSLRSKS